MVNRQELHVDTISPAERRVSTQELAKAVAALEARKQEQARQLEGTVAIGDAVKELQLEETPEEILAEVERQRADEVSLRVGSYTGRPKWLVHGNNA